MSGRVRGVGDRIPPATRGVDRALPHGLMTPEKLRGIPRLGALKLRRYSLIDPAMHVSKLRRYAPVGAAQNRLVMAR